MHVPPAAALLHEPVPASVTVVLDGDVAVVCVAGDLDVWSDEALRTNLAWALTLAGRGLVLDLERCSFVSGRPFTTIWSAATFLRARGQTFDVRHPPASFMIMTELMGRGEVPVGGGRTARRR